MMAMPSANFNQQADVSDAEFRRLIEEARLGDPDAIGTLLTLYGPHIHRVVRSHLNRRLRTRFDSQDFVQAVCVSALGQRSRLQQFERPEELIAYLGAMATNKVIDECRRCLIYEKQNVNRERPLEQAALVRTGGATASQEAVAREVWDALLKDQPPHYQQIVELRIGGATFEEIAAQVGFSARHIRRIIRALSERLEG